MKGGNLLYKWLMLVTTYRTTSCFVCRRTLKSVARTVGRSPWLLINLQRQKKKRKSQKIMVKVLPGFVWDYGNVNTEVGPGAVERCASCV